MKVNAINTVYSRPMVKKQQKTMGLKQDTPVQQADSISFKGIKNAARGGGLGILVGAIVGSIFLPGLGTAAGAATMAAIVGGVGAVRGAMEDDKNNMFKDPE